jgi:glycosyltransferase involved in cell wall biosynthesis
MPVRNGAALLQAAVDSILAQTFEDFELLIIDDGSTDETPKILEALCDPRVRIVTHPQNLGLVPTLNEGLQLARGELVARQDHDDLSYPERLAKQVAYLRAHPDCVLLGAEAFAAIGNESKAYRLLRPAGMEAIRWYQCFDNPFIHSAVMFRRNPVREEFGGYPRSFHSEDYALWSRIATLHETANLAEPLLAYREHAASVTGSMSPEAAASFDAATQHIRWQNLQALFGPEATMDDARVLSTYRRDFSPAKADEFLRVFDRLASIRAPRVRDAVEFQRVQAIQLAELAYRLLPLARWKAFRLYARAITLHSAIITVLPWLRIAALFFLGDSARSLYLALTSRKHRPRPGGPTVISRG